MANGQNLPSFTELFEAARAGGGAGTALSEGFEGFQKGQELSRTIADQQQGQEERKQAFLQKIEEFKAGTIQPGEQPGEGAPITRPITPAVSKELREPEIKPATLKTTIKENKLTGLNEILDASGKVLGIAGTGPEATPKGELSNKFNQLNPIQRKDIKDAVEDFSKDKTVQVIRDQFVAMSTISALVLENPENALGQIQTQLTLASGEKGRLTDQDISRNSPRALKNKVLDLVQRIRGGNFSDISREDILILANVLQRARKEKLDGLLNDRVNVVKSTLPNVDKKFIKDFIRGSQLSFLEAPEIPTKIIFKTVEEANLAIEAGKLPDRTEILIDGKRAIVEVD